MATIIHRPVYAGTIGSRDSYGFGSSATACDYPELGLRGIVTAGSTGGVRHPNQIMGSYAHYPPDSCGPVLSWDSEAAPIYRVGDTIIRPIRIDGQNCFEQTDSD